jgi:hypothetical protein
MDIPIGVLYTFPIAILVLGFAIGSYFGPLTLLFNKQPGKKLYSYVMSAQKEGGIVNTARISNYIIIRDSLMDIDAVAEAKNKEQHPEADGWKNHTIVLAVEIPPKTIKLLD